MVLWLLAADWAAVIARSEVLYGPSHCPLGVGATTQSHHCNARVLVEQQELLQCVGDLSVPFHRLHAVNLGLSRVVLQR
jgi:hypothetical protein